MIPGHTKFICDAKFGSIKKLYKTSLINTVDNVEEVINNSSEYSIVEFRNYHECDLKCRSFLYCVMVILKYFSIGRLTLM